MCRRSLFSFFFTGLVSFSVPCVFAQSIYSGGIGDGFSFSNFSQADNIFLNIYSGGDFDGFALASFAQPNNVLFDIYQGGINDGFALNSFAQPDNILFDIYKGGIRDGFALSSFAQSDNILFDIYKGGISDGFALNSVGSIGGEVPLPVELVLFTGTFQNGYVYLFWKTASELNNELFIVERSSDGIYFIALHAVEGAGTTNIPKEYSFIDKKPLPGPNYYRLKQIDFDQKFTYSKIIFIQADEQVNSPLTVYPNPSFKTDVVHLTLAGIINGTLAEVKIIDVSGRPIYSTITTVNNTSQIKIAPEVSSTIAPGVYLIKVNLPDRTLAAKWVVR